MISDFITGGKVKWSEKEKVRQEIGRQLTLSMATDFPIGVDGVRKSVDIAVFEPGALHDATNLRRAVICRPFPKLGKRAFVKDRDFEQTLKDLCELKAIVNHPPLKEWAC